MISKNLIKLVKSLEQKKYRRREQLFVAEGPKAVHDLMAISEPKRIIATESWYSQNNLEADVVVTEDELRKVSFLQHPQEVMALFPRRWHSTMFKTLAIWVRLSGWPTGSASGIFSAAWPLPMPSVRK